MACLAATEAPKSSYNFYAEWAGPGDAERMVRDARSPTVGMIQMLALQNGLLVRWKANDLFTHVCCMSAYASRAAEKRTCQHRRDVPFPDSCTAAKPFPSATVDPPPSHRFETAVT